MASGANRKRIYALTPLRALRFLSEDAEIRCADINLLAAEKSRFFFSAAMLNCLALMAPALKKTEPELNFEKAMDRLEEIVEQMESGKMMLEELIVRYEEGMKLVKICQERLRSAEQRIEIITRNNAGKPVVKDFEPAGEKETVAQQEEKGVNKNDEVRLF
jgi:exodeoxyribonuclease VII small subunit